LTPQPHSRQARDCQTLLCCGGQLETRAPETRNGATVGASCVSANAPPYPSALLRCSAPCSPLDNLVSLPKGDQNCPPAPATGLRPCGFVTEARARFWMRGSGTSVFSAHRSVIQVFHFSQYSQPPTFNPWLLTNSIHGVLALPMGTTDLARRRAPATCASYLPSFP